MEIKDLSNFIRAAQDDFFEKNPSAREKWHYHLGCLIINIREGRLDESKFISAHLDPPKPKEGV